MSSIDGKDSATRKAHPVFSGVLAYFPDAILAVAELSKLGNDKHNPGQPLHWARDKSNDHADCLTRHQLDAGKFDPEWEKLGHKVRHSTEVAWRALAQLQVEIEAGVKHYGTPVWAGVMTDGLNPGSIPERRKGVASRRIRNTYLYYGMFRRNWEHHGEFGRRSTDKTSFTSLPMERRTGLLSRRVGNNTELAKKYLRRSMSTTGRRKADTSSYLSLPQVD